MQDPRIASLDTSQPGPIRHESLPPELVERIKKIQALLAEVDPTPLDKVIEDFRRDLHPEREVAIWEKIAADYQQALSEQPAMTITEKKQLLGRLITTSTKDNPIRLNK